MLPGSMRSLLVSSGVQGGADFFEQFRRHGLSPNVSREGAELCCERFRAAPLLESQNLYLTQVSAWMARALMLYGAVVRPRAPRDRALDVEWRERRRGAIGEAAESRAQGRVLVQGRTGARCGRRWARRAAGSLRVVGSSRADR